ncbi:MULTISPECIES: sensor histidine kinase [Prauserella salsuginis group]|uniref:histidine kinase n=1 Tax=Prauserella salsuginis TaxID=387889 RepID=A0ABW6FYW0_9PSEU|nr:MULTISPECIES: histidine kinase [Prauserella salsuginis group]MCR3720503.1 Signal transduction histidine kinase [Prauserella flava]MCR3733787.1 Signal transduction histidine kinase [Prauserella salsuginis]
MPDTSPFRERVTRLLRQVDPAIMVLLAAVLADLAVLLPAATDGVGMPLVDLIPLPGILLLAACAVTGRSRPVFAGWSGACVLGANSVLINFTDAPTFSTLLPETSFAECVAGLLLVYYCARSAPAAIAVVTISALVTAEVATAVLRDAGVHILQLAGMGLALLVVAVVPGARARQGIGDGALGTLLRQQWLLVGVLALALFLDASIVLSGPDVDLVMIVPAIAAVVLALRGVNHPFSHAFGISGVIAATTMLALLTRADRYVSLGGVPVAVTASGMVVTALLVRLESPRRAVTAIATLSAAVAIGTVVQIVTFIQPFTHYDRRFQLLQGLAVTAVLLLGISVAIGLFLRARDSERKTTVEAAVAEAQTAERMALARELHDVVAHHVTGIVVQAQAVRIVAEQNPHVVADSLGQIETAGTEALAAMRRLVRSMRGETGDAAAAAGEQPGPGEQATTDLDADLRKLATSAVHGVPVQLDVDVPQGLPQEVARSALRIVQEALTNVSKHATGASAAWATVRGETDAGGPDESGRALLHIRVADDGEPGEPGPLAAVGGYGLVGMRERVELLGGTLTADRHGGGWVVEAWLPLQGDEESQ